MSLPVYYDPHLIPGDTVMLAGDEARHAHVKRTQVGELVDVVNGEGLRITVNVTSSTPSQLAGAVVKVVEEPVTTHPITLVQALAKGGRDESAVEGTVEIGATAIIPWQADRSIVRWSGPKAAKGVAKWQQVALAAMKQSRQAHLPQVADVVTTSQLAVLVREVVNDGGRVFICHETASDGLASAVIDGAGPLWIIVGPEGGISSDELERLVDAGGEPVLLGHSVLRSGTAGMVAATVLQVKSGYWR